MTNKTEGKQNKPHLFQPGQSGNPAGRPAGVKNLTTKVKEALEKIAESEGEKVTYEEQLVKTILEKAITEKDNKMIELIWNYLDGKPRQSIGLDGGEDKPIEISDTRGINDLIKKFEEQLRSKVQDEK